MRKLLVIMIVALLCAACENKNTVNILISNRNDRDTTQVAVKVSVDEVLKHLNAQAPDSLILLNEKNQQVDFTVSPAGDNIEFVVPIVKARSQKNFSINTGNTQLSDNLFSFRKASISVDL